MIFSELYEKHRELLEEDRVLIIKGNTDIREEDDDVKLIGEAITPLPKEPKQLFLKISPELGKEHLMNLRQLLHQQHGDLPVYLYFEDEKKMLLLEEEFWAQDDPHFFSILESVLGREAINLQELKAN